MYASYTLNTAISALVVMAASAKSSTPAVVQLVPVFETFQSDKRCHPKPKLLAYIKIIGADGSVILGTQYSDPSFMQSILCNQNLINM